MTKLILSTGNVMSAGPSVIRKRGARSKSNQELLNSLRDNFVAAQQDYVPAINGAGPVPVPVDCWTERVADTLFIPRIDWAGAGLRDEANQYEITVKLFLLRGTPVQQREHYINDALDLVCKELGIQTIDLLLVSFPGTSLEGNYQKDPERINAQQVNLDEEVATWKILEKLYQQGIVKNLGVSEFGDQKLSAFIERIAIRPAVNQINLKNCCHVPLPLKKVAEAWGIELNVHTDCTDILPCGTLREILGPQGAGILASCPGGDDGLQGQIAPRWVVRYLAFVQDRGVIENKGYFAGADLEER